MKPIWKKPELVAGVLCLAGTSAMSQEVIEIRHDRLKERSNYALHYWCLERGDIPEDYDDGAYSIGRSAMPVTDAGALIMNFGDNTVFLTTAECLDETKEAISSFGGNLDDIDFIEK